MANETEPSLPLDIPEQPEAVAGQKIGYARVSSKDQNRSLRVYSIAPFCRPCWLESCRPEGKEKRRL